MRISICPLGDVRLHTPVGQESMGTLSLSFRPAGPRVI